MKEAVPPSQQRPGRTCDTTHRIQVSRQGAMRSATTTSTEEGVRRGHSTKWQGQACAVRENVQCAELHWKGGDTPPPTPESEPMPSHCLTDAKCQRQ